MFVNSLTHRKDGAIRKPSEPLLAIPQHIIHNTLKKTGCTFQNIEFSNICSTCKVSFTFFVILVPFPPS